MSESSSYREGALLDDGVELTAMDIETSTRIDPTDSENSSSCLPSGGISSVLCGSSSSTSSRPSRKSSLAELVSYIGFRGVALIIALKVIGLIIFALFFVGYTTSSTVGDVSQVTLAKGRPENLREKIRTATIKASGISNFAETEKSQNDGSWSSNKDSVATITTTSSTTSSTSSSTASEIAATRAADKASVEDPLAVDAVAPALLVHSFEDVPYTVLLNKFNTVKDHCLIVSNDFAPQIAPLRGAELELLHWTLLQTRGVGFYNSNLLAGASQAHRHVQFIPGDAIWRLRNPDAAHALPIDDVIMPRIESGKWRAFPYTPRASSGVPVDASGVHKYKYHDKGNTLDNLKEKLQTAQLHQLDQFDFQHGVAVLLDRSSFLTYGSAAIKAYSDYLEQAYEALLRSNDISIDTLRQCAAAASPAAAPAPVTIIHHSDEEESDDLTTSTAGTVSVATEHLNCVEQAGYNVILRPQYMLLVPRAKKDFASAVNVNSFGFMGLFLATNEVAKGLIKDVGPLEILKVVGRPKHHV